MKRALRTSAEDKASGTWGGGERKCKKATFEKSAWRIRKDRTEAVGLLHPNQVMEFVLPNVGSPRIG